MPAKIDISGQRFGRLTVVCGETMSQLMEEVAV